MNSKPEKLLGNRDLADRWQINLQTLHNWHQQGRLPRRIKLGGAVRYRLSDVEAFEEAHADDAA